MKTFYSPIKKTPFCSFTQCFFFLVLLWSLPVISQKVQQKKLTVDDYHLWSDLQIKDLSENGEWVSYTLSYESGLDTLFVKNTTNKKQFPFPKGYNGSFSKAGWFAVRNPKGLSLVHLKSGKQQQIDQVTSYAFSGNGTELIYCTKQSGVNKLAVLRLGSEIVVSVEGVKQFKMDNSKEKIVFNSVTKDLSTVEIVSFGKNFKRETILKETKATFHGFEWNTNDEGIAFFKKMETFKNRENNTVILYDLKTKMKYELDAASFPDFPKDGAIVPFGMYKLTLSDDLDKVFFAVDFPPKPTNSKVQLWAGNAPWIYPQEQFWVMNNTARMAVWFPQEDRFQMLTSEEHPWIMFTGDYNAALVANPKIYEPQFEVANGPMDFYLVNLKSGKKELLLQKQSSYVQATLPSPAGKYIAYFRDADWWVYDIKNKQHKNITGNLPTPFESEAIDRPVERTAVGCPGWTRNDETIVLYDQNDIWEINPVTGKSIRLTHGKENNIQFRFKLQHTSFYGKENYNGWLSTVVDLDDDVMLNGLSKDGNLGVYLWSKNSVERKLFDSNKKISQLKQNGTVIICKEQSFDLPPRILISESGKKLKTVIQSNKQHWSYQWPMQKEIVYKDSKGNELKGYLCYPSDYDTSKKYPMVVPIYERQFNDRHNYINPSIHSDVGFNVIDFNADGYFVFFPDIQYEIGNLGFSAVDCTIAGTKAVIDLGLIDEQRIGLIGHSFGGYETDFIITQTNLFKAAVAGSAATDMRSFYLTYNWNSGTPDMWRFEHQQWRMGTSYFENKMGYELNSPLNQAERINTPLLAWAGNQDKQVNWLQSIDFYLALRRLGKKQLLLLYENEGHSLKQKENQIDLGKRIKQWFGYFLKEETNQGWIEERL